ncbi:hypothetical protein [Streptomyces sp. NPDC047706]|uniref:hypothetical protein n=1 Tax=Streptomyces sp. NPDC047706 TaxID=3365486 RepID=UPI00371792DE
MNDAVPHTQAPADASPQVSAEVPQGVDTQRPQEAAGPGHDPAAPAPLGVPRIPTGNAEVDGLLERLADADHLATDGHVEVYEDVHRGLRDALTALDARPGPPAPPSTYRQGS